MAQVKPVNTKKMSKNSIIALVICIAILIAFVATLLAQSGLFVRMQEGASSENFKVNGSMMSYYTQSYYQNWLSQYYYYILYGMINFDMNKPLDEQYTDANKTQTYYDFFAQGAATQVTKLLVYCEEALADPEINFDELNKEAEDYAAESIASLKESAKKNKMDFADFLRQNFGAYVSESDLYDALVIEYIASDYSTTLYERIYDSMTPERKEEYFKENLKSFVKASYLTFSLSDTVVPEKVDEKQFEGGKDSQEYKDAVAAANEKAKKENEMNMQRDREFLEKLYAAKDAEEFKSLLIEYKFDEAFTTAYEEVVKGFSDADKPSEEVVTEYKNSVKEAILKAVMDGKSDITEDKETETADETTKTPWEKESSKIPAKVITALNKVIKSATVEASYDVSTDVGKFLFQGVKAQYGIKLEENDPTGENAEVGEARIFPKEFSESEKEAAEAIGKYTLTVYYVTEEAHRDETILRDVGHILIQVDEEGKTEGAYKTKEEAKAVADALFVQVEAKATDGIITKEDFESFAEHNNDGNMFYDDVNKGDMVEEFEEWLFAAKTVGEIGMVETSYGYHIMYYGGETVPAWEFSAHESAASEDLTEFYEELAKKHSVDINESLFKTILG